MNLRISNTDPSILEALLLQASASWRSLECLISQGEVSSQPLAAALLRALCLSPLQEMDSGKPSLDALAQLNHRSACALALSRTLMALAQEYLLVGDTSRAQVSLVQSLASNVNAVLATGMPIPAKLADQLLSQADQLASTLSCQLDLAMAIRDQHMPSQIVLVLGINHHEILALASMLWEAGIIPLPYQKHTNSGDYSDYGKSQTEDDLTEQLLLNLDCHPSSCWKLSAHGWDIHSATVRSWRTRMLQQLQTAYPSGGKAVLLHPRLTFILPAFRPWLEADLISCAVFLPIRHPADVAASIRLAEGIPCRQTLLLWLGHVFQAERNCRSFQRLIIDYQMLRGETQAVLRNCAELLGVEIGDRSLPDFWKSAKISSSINLEVQQHQDKANLPNWVVEEKAEAWYDLALRVHTVLLDTEIEEQERRSTMDQFWLQWTSIAP